MGRGLNRRSASGVPPATKCPPPLLLRHVARDDASAANFFLPLKDIFVWGQNGCGHIWRPSLVPNISSTLKDAVCQHVCTGGCLGAARSVNDAEDRTIFTDVPRPSGNSSGHPECTRKQQQGTLYQIFPSLPRSSTTPAPQFWPSQQKTPPVVVDARFGLILSQNVPSNRRSPTTVAG